MHQQAQLRLKKDEVEAIGAATFCVVAMDLHRTRQFKEKNLLFSQYPESWLSKFDSLVYSTAVSDPAGTASALYGVSRRAMRWGSWVENSPTWVVIDRKGILTLIHAPKFSTPTGHVQDVDLVLEELRKGSK